MNTDSQQQALAGAKRLLRIDDVLAAVQPAARGSLAHGLAGTALLHARLSATDSTFAAAAAAHWTEAAIQAKELGENGAGTYHSPGGLAASLTIGTPYLPDPDSQRAATARAALWLSARAVELADRHRGYLNAGGIGTPWHVYDAITGLAGIGRVLLASIDSGHNSAEPGLIAALDVLTAMIQTRYGARPGWWVSADNHPPGMHFHTSGAANTGMAHGIAGPLALLALANMAGWSVAGQDAAIQEAAHWLLRWRTNDIAVWPPHLTGDELDSDIASPVPGRGDAWCYGIPGISRSLALAGQAIGDPQLTSAADIAMSSLAGRPVNQWDVEGPTLCHGYAGVLQSAVGSQSGAAERAAAAITASFDPTHRFGFKHQENDSTSDEPGFLIGTAGVALALADHGGLPASAVPTSWDALLLLS